MQSEIFRFMTIRPPQAVDSKTKADNIVSLDNLNSELIKALIGQKNAGSRAEIEKLVQNFLKSNAAEFIDSRKKVDSKFIAFYEAVLELDDQDFLINVRKSFVAIFDNEPQKIVGSEEYRQISINVTNSIIVAAIDQNIEAKVRSLLTNIAKILGLIAKLVDPSRRPTYSKADFNSQIILLPEGIFPLPSVKQSLTKLDRAEKERLAKIAKNRLLSLKS